MTEYMEDTLGNFVGIGAYMANDESVNKIIIIAPMSDSPAQSAGILSGDYILSVDGIEYTGEEIDIAITNIKGEENTTVSLEILRGEEILTIEVNREKIIINPVTSEMLEDNIGYISFLSFDEDTSESFKTELESLQNSGMESLIIDLRNNGGGLVSSALEIADYFVDKDIEILYEVDKDGNETVEISETDKIVSDDLEIVILTNGYSASSSEILAAILKERANAISVGQTTYGKGIIQEILSLPDGSGLKITTAKYLTPDRLEIHEIGIEPDYEVSLPDDIDNIYSIEYSDDTQLQKAVEVLQNN